MTELFIAVSCPGQAEITYSFDRFPVHIGRLPSCDLSIRHEAVARELCSVWVEPDGKTVRVEERPGLTNPLLSGTVRVFGGLSAEVANLTVGPIRLSIFTDPSARTSSNHKKRFILLGGLAALVLIFVVLGNRPSMGQRKDVLSSLPKHPFCQPTTLDCEDPVLCLEQARLAVSRGREMISRPLSRTSDHIRGVSLMTAGLERIKETASKPEAHLQDEIRAAKQNAIRAYQQEVIALRAALRSGNDDAVRAAAATVLTDLETCDDAVTTPLRRLSTSGLKKGR